MANSKKKTLAEKQAEPISEDLKIRILEARKKLPKSGVSTLFFHYFDAEYLDTVKNRSKVNNVLQCRQTDADVTAKIEKLVELLEH
jgi:hypothetical protein